MHFYTVRTSLVPLKYLYCLSFCFLWLLSPGQKLQAQAIEEGLLLHYNFDTVENTTIPDVSGNNNHGSIYGSAAPTADWSGNALECLEVTDYALLPNNINASLSNFSVAVWVKGNASWNTWSRIFDFGRGTTHY
ncbi:MAG: hypothetical protein PHF92_10755, partial [Bacteroidales bacterium]|nr:hypothetical protein [Bacteroidales bacterium]